MASVDETRSKRPENHTNDDDDDIGRRHRHPSDELLFEHVAVNNGFHDSRRLPLERAFARGGAENSGLDGDRVLESDVDEIKRILRVYMERLDDKDSRARVTREWRLVAKVLDRLFFFMYVSTIVVSIATIFPRTG